MHLDPLHMPYWAARTYLTSAFTDACVLYSACTSVLYSEGTQLRVTIVLVERPRRNTQNAAQAVVDGARAAGLERARNGAAGVQEGADGY